MATRIRGPLPLARPCTPRSWRPRRSRSKRRIYHYLETSDLHFDRTDCHYFCLHDLQAGYDHADQHGYERLCRLVKFPKTIHTDQKTNPPPLVTSTKTSTSLVTSSTVLTSQSTTSKVICKTVPIVTPVYSTSTNIVTNSILYTTPCDGKPFLSLRSNRRNLTTHC
jgi:hypothetical protein